MDKKALKIDKSLVDSPPSAGRIWPTNEHNTEKVAELLSYDAK